MLYTGKGKAETLQNLKSTDSDFIPTIKALIEDLSQHIKEEEESDCHG